jgi:hypothetical protein
MTVGSSKRSWSANLVGACLLAALLAGLVSGSIWLFSVLSSLKGEVLGPTLVGFVTVLGSVTVVVYAKRQERKRENEFELRKKKAVVYEEFVEVLFGSIFAVNAQQGPTQQGDPIDDLRKLTRQMVPWAADGVIRKFSNFRRTLLHGANTGHLEQSDTLLLLEGILLEIRKDLGHKNEKLNPGDLLTLFINDLDANLQGQRTQG